MDSYRECLNGKKLLLLGSTRNDIEFVKACKELGVFIGVTDWNKLEDAPAKRLADKYYNISIADKVSIDRIIREDGYDGVITGFSDGYLKFYQEICEYSGLNCYATKNQIDIFTNKTKYKELLRKYEVPTLKNYNISDIDESFEKFPLMIKPAIGSGGKGLAIANNYEEFKLIISEIDNYEDLVIERYISDRNELTAFFLFVDGEVFLLGTANRFLSKPQGDKIGLPILYSLPSSYDEKFKKEVYPNMKKMFEDVGMKNGILFAQCMLVDNEINIYDIGYRVTGTMEFKIFEKLYGIDTLKMLISYALLGKMNPLGIDINERLKREGYGVNVTIQGNKGVVKKIKGIENLLNDDRIIDVAIKTAPDEEITEEMIGTLSQIVARIFFTSDSLEDALNMIKYIYNNIEVYDENNDDMILDRIDEKKIIDIYRQKL